MKLEDFYELKINQDIWYKGEKTKVKMLLIDDCNEFLVTVNLEDGHDRNWQDIMQDCSLEEPFLVRKDCVSCVYEGEQLGGRDYSCNKFNSFINGLDTGGRVMNCNSCPNYDKKKEVVRYYAQYLVGEHGNTSISFPCQFPYEQGLTRVFEPKVCPETNRIYIEEPNE